MLLLTGYLGASSEANHTRLYFDAALSNYVEIPDDAILHTQDISTDASSLAGTNVWIKKDAVLTHGKVGTQRTKAKFLEGAIVNNFMKAAAFPQEGGIDNTVAFCPQTFADLPCGFTTVPIACTILDIPTQQQYCPTRWHCPPPPTPNCPTRHPPFICHTRICNIGMAAAQLEAQPLGITLGQCITVPPQCPGITHQPVCVTQTCTVNQPFCPTTHTSPLCPTLTSPVCGYTSAGPVCHTHTPACFPTLGIVCTTHTPPCITQHGPCHTHLFICPPITQVGCPLPTHNCPSFGACPSIACGFGGGGGMGI